MPQSATILQELKELESSLPAGLNPTGYKVPDGYFDGLAASILQRVKADQAGTPAAELAELSPFLAGISGKTPYTVPENYFEELNPSFVFTEEDSTSELQKLSPLLGGLSRKSPFSVPEGYFDRQVAIPEERKAAPIIRMGSSRKRWYRFAAAASVAVILALGGLVWMKQNSPAGGPDKQSFAWVEKNMKKVSTEDISKFVDLAEAATPAVAAVNTTDDIRGLMKNVSDKDIQDFLKDLPVDETEDDDILFN